MKYNNRVSLLMLTLISFQWLFYSCIPTRVGKIKRIRTDQIAKGDSVQMYAGFYGYQSLGGEFVGTDWDMHNDDQKALEKKWDSTLFAVARSYFRIDSLGYQGKYQYYKLRPFKFRILLGGPVSIQSDSISFLISSALWNMRAGNMDKALSFIPDSILRQSHTQPVMLISYYFYFYEIEFGIGYGGEVSTGLNVIPDGILAVIKNRDIIFMNNYSKRVKHSRLDRSQQISERFIRKLFTGLRKPASPRKITAP